MKKIVLVFTASLLLSVPSYADSPLKRLIQKRNTEVTTETNVPSMKVDLNVNLIPVEPEYLPDLDDRATDLDADSGGDGVIPADELYAIWDNLTVNPYKVPSDSILVNDSVFISLANFSYPLVNHIRITSEFGPRRYRYHYGIDLKVYKGDSILSAMDGMVRIAKKVGNYGNLVVVRHNNGLESFYGHLDKILVKPDQYVKSGELIGHGGNTGRSTGSHLHFELRYLGQCMNPRDLVDFDSLCAKGDTVMISQENFSYRKKSALAKGSGSRVWTIKSGDSLSRIAKRTGTSIKYLCSVNGITTKTVLRIGRKLYY